MIIKFAQLLGIGGCFVFTMQRRATANFFALVSSIGLPVWSSDLVVEVCLCMCVCVCVCVGKHFYVHRDVALILHVCYHSRLSPVHIRTLAVLSTEAAATRTRDSSSTDTQFTFAKRHAISAASLHCKAPAGA